MNKTDLERRLLIALSDATFARRNYQRACVLETEARERGKAMLKSTKAAIAKGNTAADVARSKAYALMLTNETMYKDTKQELVDALLEQPA